MVDNLLATGKSENGIASYDFADIAAGNGSITYYLGKANNYKLTNAMFKGYPIKNGGVFTNVGAFPFKALDVDYDLTVVKTMIVQGNLIANIPTMTNTGGGAVSTYIVLRLRKYSGSTETEIANAQSTTITVGAGTTYANNAIDFDVPKTAFAVGDKIRITVEMWEGSGTGGAGYRAYGQSPAGGTDSDWGSTTVAPSSVINIPMLIQGD